MKRISVFGLGYVGAVTSACLAEIGHQVVGVDANPAKTETLEAGRAPVLEPGLDDLVVAARKNGRLRATTDVAAAVSESDISFVCVGTPSLPNGQLDFSSIEHVCEEIGIGLRPKTQFHLVVLR